MREIGYSLVLCYQSPYFPLLRLATEVTGITLSFVLQVAEVKEILQQPKIKYFQGLRDCVLQVAEVTGNTDP